LHVGYLVHLGCGYLLAEGVDHSLDGLLGLNSLGHNLFIANILRAIRGCEAWLAHTQAILAVSLAGAMIRTLGQQFDRCIFREALLTVWLKVPSKTRALAIVTEPVAKAVVRARCIIIRLMVDNAVHVESTCECSTKAQDQNT